MAEYICLKFKIKELHVSYMNYLLRITSFSTYSVISLANSVDKNNAVKQKQTEIICDARIGSGQDRANHHEHSESGARTRESGLVEGRGSHSGVS